MLLGDLNWTDLAGDRQHTLVVPVGSIEQHGPHLPLSVDVRIADAVAAGLHDHDPDLVIAPALAYGAAVEHEGFPGTISLGHRALSAVLVEYGRSAFRWASRLLLVNGHRNNIGAMVTAVTVLREDGRDAAWVSCLPPVRLAGSSGSHAGLVETSLMLALAPHLVRMEAAAAGATEPWLDLVERIGDHGMAAVSPNGVLGDPANASAEEGRRLLDGLHVASAAALARWDPDPYFGQLR